MANNLYDFVTIEAQQHQEALERQGFYTDDTPVGPLEDELKNIKSPLALQYANWLRTKQHGADILESQARWGLLMAKQALDAIEQSGDAKEAAKDLSDKFNNLTTEYLNFKEDVQKEKDAVIANATVDSEVILARGGKPTLGARLDETTAQLAHTLKIFREVTVNINDFGAVYDDDTFDNMTAISAAQDYLESFGGGQIYFPKNGDLYVKPFLNIKKGTYLLGSPERPRLVISPDVSDFWKLFGFEDRENVGIKNIEIDSNLENRTGFDLDIAPQILLSFAGTKNVVLENNKLIGNGIWVISAFTGGDGKYSENIKMRDNHIVWKAGHSSQKQNLPPGVQIDNTCVYFDAIGYIIEHNLFETADGLKNMTCIEAHGADAIVEKNTIKGFRTGIILWSLVETPNKEVDSNNLKVLNNNFIKVENGITIGATKGFSLKNVQVKGNTTLLDPKKFSRGSSRGIEINLPADSVLENVQIYENETESMVDDTTYADVNFAYNFTGISVVSGLVRNLSMKLNTVKNIPGTGLLISNAVNSKVKITDSDIERNTFINCGRNTNIATTATQGRSAIGLFVDADTDITGLSLGVNTIIDERPTGTYFTRPVYGPIPSMLDQRIKTVDRPEWFAKRMYSPVIAFDSQIGNITTKRKGSYQFEKNVCKVKFEFEVTASSITQGYSAYVTLPFDADISESFLGGHFNLFGPDFNIAGVLTITTSNLKVALLQPVTTATRFPVGTKLIGQIEYPVAASTKYVN